MSDTTLIREIPTGVINGTNKVFTVALPISSVLVSYIDGGVAYLGTTTVTEPYTITYGDAPTATIVVDYYTATAPVPAPANGTSLSTYLDLLTQKLAQSNTGFHTMPSRIQAVNEAILFIADRYEVPELRKRPIPSGEITFINGVSPIPEDMLRVIKIWDPVTVNQEYTYLVNDLFDQQPVNAVNFTWTIDFDPSAAAQRMFIQPSNVSVKSLNFRYLSNPFVLSSPMDQSGLSYHWDYGVAYKAAAILLRNERNPATQATSDGADGEIEKAYQALRKVGGVKQGERLRSRFEKYPLLYSAQV